MDTGARKWGSPYLNRRFFELIDQRMAERIVLFLAEDGAHPIAAALNFVGSDTLFGRYWGRLADTPFLHFELCYYQAIDYAIAHGLARVEAGAQGEHKLARGYAPVATHSAHWIAHPGLRAAVARYLDAEGPAVAEEIELLDQHTPFKTIEI
jgi:predicted N-acyltransferase